MEPSPTLPPGVAALARSMGLGQLADQAEQVLAATAAEPTAQPRDTACAVDLLRHEVEQLRAELAPLVAIAAQLGPLLQLPKVQRALAKQQG